MQSVGRFFCVIIDLVGVMALWAIALKKSLGQLDLPRVVDNFLFMLYTKGKDLLNRADLPQEPVIFV